MLQVILEIYFKRWVAELYMTSLWLKMMKFIYVAMVFVMLAIVELGLNVDLICYDMRKVTCK
jgi:hypothetical protein